MRRQVPDPLVDQVDDVASSVVGKCPREGLDKLEGGAQIHLHMGFPGLFGHRFGRVLLKHRGIIDKTCDRADPVRRPFDQPRRFIFDLQVRLNRCRFAALAPHTTWILAGCIFLIHWLI